MEDAIRLPWLEPQSLAVMVMFSMIMIIMMMMIELIIYPNYLKVDATVIDDPMVVDVQDVENVDAYKVAQPHSQPITCVNVHEEHWRDVNRLDVEEFHRVNCCH